MLDELRTIAIGLDHPEGVAWGHDGRIYAGGEAGQVYAIDTDGRVEEIASTGGFMYGITLDGDGNIYACDFGRSEVSRIDTRRRDLLVLGGNQRSADPRAELRGVRRRRRPLRH